jgi:hypothetical protein
MDARVNHPEQHVADGVNLIDFEVVESAHVETMPSEHKIDPVPTTAATVNLMNCDQIPSTSQNVNESVINSPSPTRNESTTSPSMQTTSTRLAYNSSTMTAGERIHQVGRQRSCPYN